MDDGGRDGAEPPAEADEAQSDLEESRGQDEDAERGDAVGGDGLVHQDGEPGGGAADLERAAGHRAGDQSADDARDEAQLGGDAGGDRDPDAEGDGDEEHDDRGEDVLGQGVRA